MRGSQNLLQGGTISAYKWLRLGAVDPDGGFEWTTVPGRRTAAVTAPPTALHACLCAGLPYEVDDELWEVVLENVIGCEPFPHQKTDGWSQQFPEDEQCLFALGGYLVRHLQTWTPQVAEEFARECALEARQRALRAVRDAMWVLGQGPISEHATLGSRMAKPSGGFPPPPKPRASEGEAVLLRHAERMLSIWQIACATDGSPALVASAFASAAAASRAAAALTYATAIDAADVSAATEAAARAYAEERRRQARWLQERLGPTRAWCRSCGEGRRLTGKEKGTCHAVRCVTPSGS